MARQATGQVIPPKNGRAWAIRFRAYGKRRYITLGTSAEGWNRQRAEAELRHVLAEQHSGLIPVQSAESEETQIRLPGAIN